MGAKLQKINNKNTKFMRVGGGTGFYWHKSLSSDKLI